MMEELCVNYVDITTITQIPEIESPNRSMIAQLFLGFYDVYIDFSMYKIIMSDYALPKLGIEVKVNEG